MSEKNNKKGFTLVEAIVGTAIFMLLAISTYQVYTTVLNIVNNSRTKITTAALANEQFEIAHNLPYADVGTINGIPNGKIPPVQSLIRDGNNFTVTTTIRNIDDPFDGSVGSTTKNDLSPADYKMMAVEISCVSCKNFTPQSFTTQIGPRDLESESTNGSLFIRVFDADARPLTGANIHIINNDVSPRLETNDTTNNDGLLQIVDAPPAVGTYDITVSKKNYSTEKTYKIGNVENPNPINANPTVVARQLTQISFFLDYVRNLTIGSLDEACDPLPDIPFTLYGTKLIGLTPDILKYNATSTTDNSGQKIISNLDYDNYTLTVDNPNYKLLGTASSTNFILNASSTGEIKLTLAQKLANSFLVTITDEANLPLSGANITLSQGTTTTATEITGPGIMACRKEGQALFKNLAPGNYTLTVSKDGYQNYQESLDLGSAWVNKEIILNP